MPPGSEPWSGSVRPKLPIACPAASFGRYCCLCASLPKTWIGSITNELCTLIIDR